MLKTQKVKVRMWYFHVSHYAASLFDVKLNTDTHSATVIGNFCLHIYIQTYAMVSGPSSQIIAVHVNISTGFTGLFKEYLRQGNSVIFLIRLRIYIFYILQLIYSVVISEGRFAALHFWRGVWEFCSLAMVFYVNGICSYAVMLTESFNWFVVNKYYTSCTTS